MRPGHRFLLAVFAVLMVGSLGRDVRTVRADESNPDVIPSFINALNTGDVAAALQLASPSLTMTLPGGLSFPISAVATVPASLLPITIVSLTPEGTGSQTVDGVFTFGGDPTPQRVQIKGNGGVIVSILVLGP
jgi:hypothetical protein